MTDRRRFKSYSADKPFDPGGTMLRVRVHYILHKAERRIEPVDTRTRAGLLRWGEWFQQSSERVIAQAHIGGCMVSTVFLGLDHGWNGPAVLFETMVFPDNDGGGWTEEYQERYHTLREAEQGHEAIVAMVMAQAENAEHTAARIIAQLKETR